jgi:hypothetical protein
MRVETNWKLVRRNRRITQYLFYFSFGVLIVGLFIGFRPPASPDDPNLATALLLQTLILPVAVVASLVSVRMTNQWLRQPRPENAIREALKGIHRKSVLYNYYHFPARHVLISPQGVFAMVTRFQDGYYRVNGDRWERSGGVVSRPLRFLRGDDIGKPTEDAQRAAAHVKQLLQPFAPDLEVQPLVIFVSPRARLEVSNPVVPVLHADDKYDPNLKDYMRDLAQKQKVMQPSSSKKKTRHKQESNYVIPPDEIEGLAQVFEDATLPERAKKQTVAE